MDEIIRLARPEIVGLAPYSSARSEGNQSEMTVFLDANESPFSPYPAGVSEFLLNRYPDPQPHEVALRCADYLGVSRQQILMTRGADEAIDLLVRAFCSARIDAITTCPPTFGMYEVAAAIQDIGVRYVPLSDAEFAMDVDGVVASGRGDAKLVFLCSPNNPTGNLLQRGDILAACAALHGHALVVVDQTYVAFSGEPSLVDAIAEHPNLVVLRTLSKENGLAGERFGITVAHPVVIDILRPILAPYPLPRSVLAAVAAAMTPQGLVYASARRADLLRERDRVATAIESNSAVRHVFASDANFLLVEVERPTDLMRAMEAAGIKIRDRSSLTYTRDCVRISIGTPPENERMLGVLAEHGTAGS
jgi:histidinol-phosphate aminotransferase